MEQSSPTITYMQLVEVMKNLCRFCQQTDSLEQRHWRCAATQTFREHLTDDQINYANTLPECARERAWFPEPREIVDFKNSLNNIPDTSRQWEPITIEADCIDVFTDGTAIDPATPEARLLEWSAVVANSQEYMRYWGVPGQWQTVLRAEITAVVSALGRANVTKKDKGVWCDNDTVVKEFRKFQQTKAWTKQTALDHDLWNRLKKALDTHTGSSSIGEVDSHQDETIADDFQKWVRAGNNAADPLARVAIGTLPHSVVEKQKTAAEIARRTNAYNSILLDMYAKIGMFAATN